MVDITRAFPSRFLKAADLQGRTIAVTIRHVDRVTMARGAKWVVFFDGKHKGLILNKTIAQQIAAIAQSPDTDRWPGTRIALVPAETTFGKDVVPCVRVARPPLAAVSGGSASSSAYGV